MALDVRTRQFVDGQHQKTTHQRHCATVYRRGHHLAAKTFDRSSFNCIQPVCFYTVGKYYIGIHLNVPIYILLYYTKLHRL